jgi:hypothetical protein
MVEDLDVGKLKSIAQEAIGLMCGYNFGWSLSGIRTHYSNVNDALIA